VSGHASIEAAFRHCRTITRQRARNFYYGLKLQPEPQRSALYAVYAWMRHADDLADEARDPDTARSRIVAFRQATADALTGRSATDDPVMIGLQATAARFALDPEHFHAMLDGQLDDLEVSRYETFDELRTYAYRVASTVGLICISIWGYDEERAPALAIERGLAFQLTNILRDFVEDLDQGRVYLPAEDFQRAGITPATLRDWSDDARCRAFLIAQIDRAEAAYQASAPLEGMITPDCRPTLWAMTRIYHGLLAKMRNDPARIVAGPRLRLSSLEKGAIAVRALARRRGAPRPAGVTAT